MRVRSSAAAGHKWFRLAARWNRAVEAVKTRKKREKTGGKWARYGLKGVKESGSPDHLRWQLGLGGLLFRPCSDSVPKAVALNGVLEPGRAASSARMLLSPCPRDGSSQREAEPKPEGRRAEPKREREAEPELEAGSEL